MAMIAAAPWAGFKCATRRKAGRGPNDPRGSQLVYCMWVPGKGLAAQLTDAGIAYEAQLKANGDIPDTFPGHAGKVLLDLLLGADRVPGLAGPPAVAAAAHFAVLTGANVDQAPAPVLDMAMAPGVRVSGLPLVCGDSGSRSQQCSITAMVRIANHAWGRPIDHSFVPVFVTALTDMRPVGCRPRARAPPASKPCP